MQLLLDLELHRKTVRVPPRLTLDVEALHGLVPAEEVLEGPSQDVVSTRLAIGGRGAFVEDEARLALADVERLAEGVLLLPGRLHLALERRKVDALVNFRERHRRSYFLGHLISQTRKRFRLGRALYRPAVPPRFPRPLPRTLIGLRLGSDLGHRTRPPCFQLMLGSLSTEEAGLPVSVNADRTSNSTERLR